MSVRSTIHLSVALLVAAMTTVTVSAQETISSPVIFARSVFILQDYVDNYERGLEAGGTHQAFGADLGSFGISDSGEGRSGGFAAKLATDADGFATGTGFIGYGKTFATATAADGSQSNTINASAFNAISYWARSAAGDPGSTVRLELVVAEGGNYQFDTNGQPVDVNTDGNIDDLDRLPGSTWTQTVATTTSTTYKRVVLALSDAYFTRTVAKSSTETLDLTKISAVNILFQAGGVVAAGTPRTLYVDDINFFVNPLTVELLQTQVFARAGSGAQIVVTAEVKNNGTLASGVNVKFVLVQSGDGSFAEGASPLMATTNFQGRAIATFNVGTLADIVEIRVEQP